MRREPNYLFSKYDLHSVIQGQKEKAKEKVDSIPERQFLHSSDEELFEHVFSEFEIMTLELYEDRIEIDQGETKVDVSGGSEKVHTGHPWTFFILLV